MLYNITYSDGEKTQVTADTVTVQSVNSDGTIIYRFSDTANDQTVAFISGDSKMQIIGMTGATAVKQQAK